MLTQLLTEDVIRIEPAARDWRHAIELATAPLLANGTIEPSYVAALFRSHEELGPYYVLGPGLAMPHARPEDGVNRLGLGLTVLKTGVNFGSEGMTRSGCSSPWPPATAIPTWRPSPSWPSCS